MRRISTAGATPPGRWPWPMVPPDQVSWRVGEEIADLFAAARPGAARALSAAPAFTVPKPFIALARAAICHSDPERFALLYTLLLRLRANPKALEDQADPLVRRIEAMAKEVRRDMHKMHAFVRFREVEEGGETRFGRLVRARPSYRPDQCRLLRPPLRQHEMVDPDAGAVDPLGRRNPDRIPGRDPRRRVRTATRSRRCGRPIMPRSSIRPD